MLSEIFDLKRIKLDLEGRTKPDIFEELVGTIAEENSGLNPRELLDAVSLRESKMNTYIAPGIAVPHGYCRTVNGIIGAIGFSRPGIEYYGDEQDPVHLFFMILMDESSREQHLQVLSHLWELINTKAFIEIRELRNPQEMYSLLSHY